LLDWPPRLPTAGDIQMLKQMRSVSAIKTA
jgi:hypothetical protein